MRQVLGDKFSDAGGIAQKIHHEFVHRFVQAYASERLGCRSAAWFLGILADKVFEPE